LGDTQVTHIVQIVVPVADLPAAASFYGDCLGLKEQFRAPNVIAYGLESIRLLLTERPRYTAPKESGVIFYIEVQGIEKHHSDLVVRGARDGGRPHKIADIGGQQVWVGFVLDPFGTLIGFIESRSDISSSR
jgi:catechol 2,3-dioxygenase-like lactoylglutathione lyase family enzyme